MTFIKPNQNIGFTDKLIIILGGVLVIAAAFLIMTYNRFVNFNHQLSMASKDIQSVETGNAEFKEKIFALLSGDKLDALVRERELVKDLEPQYLEINPKNPPGGALVGLAQTAEQ